MANPTTNFGWVMPAPTDLVTDLPADFAVFGQGVDTTMADLKGGTTGQILSKTTNSDMDFTWIDPNTGDITGVTAGTGISGGGTSGTVTITNSMATEITAAGDIIVGTGSGTFDNLPIGTTGQVLTADTTVSPYKVKWAAAAGGNTNPAFRAYRNGTQSITSGADTKVAFNAESYDTNSCFDSTTNYRFTPNVAGYYQFNAGISYGGSSITRLQLHIYKNGASYSRIYDASDATVYSYSGSDLIYANGTTDYFEIYGEITGSSPSFGGGDSTYTWFSGSWVRS